MSILNTKAKGLVVLIVLISFVVIVKVRSPRRDAGERLEPSKALQEIYRLSKSTKGDWQPSESERIAIAKLVEKINWPSGWFGQDDVRHFSEEAKAMSDHLSDSEDSYDFRASLALVLAAWDFHDGRKQAVPWTSNLRTSDPHAVKKDPLAGIPASYYSDEWPWRTERGKLVLGEFRVLPSVGMGAKTENFIYSWSLGRDGL